MKNLKKLNRGNLKAINGGAVCNENCPPGPYGPVLVFHVHVKHTMLYQNVANLKF